MLSKHQAQETKLTSSQVLIKYETARTYIRNNFKDGFVPYIPGHKPSTEASAWCSIALRDDQATVKRTLSAFADAQNKDGGWSTEPKLGSSDWTSGPAVLAMRVLQQHNKPSRDIDAAIHHGIEYMFDSRTEFYGSIARLLIFMTQGKTGLEYARGWPWSKDCFHWIEPTSYALYALNVPEMPKEEVYREIVERANQFVLAHECKGGGWNHGSSFCLDTYLPPYIVTTAEALLALQKSPDLPAVKAGLQFLERTEPQECSAMEHAWAILALDAHGLPTENLVHSLALSQKSDGSFGVNLMVTGLSVLAVDTAISGRNPLKYATIESGNTKSTG